MLEAAIEAAKLGGKILLGYFNTELERQIKDDKSFVTKADKESEEAIVGYLKNLLPDHSFLAEESGESKQTSPYMWIVDPLDGTANFVNGLPTFAVSIALLKDKELVTAVVYNPLTEMLVYAEKGKGLYCNGVKTRVSDQKPETAMITAGVGKIPGVKDRLANIFREAPKHIKTFRYVGSAAFELAVLARGGIEAFISLGNAKWDYAAGILLVQEGGGKITDLEGNPWNFENNFFIASNGIVHDTILQIVKNK